MGKSLSLWATFVSQLYIFFLQCFSPARVKYCLVPFCLALVKFRQFLNTAFRVYKNICNAIEKGDIIIWEEEKVGCHEYYNRGYHSAENQIDRQTIFNVNAETF